MTLATFGVKKSVMVGIVKPETQQIEYISLGHERENK